MEDFAERATVLSEPPLAAASLEGQVLCGKFLVERLLGRGGMGAVYVATHRVTQRTGALKLLDPKYAAVVQIQERFVREASAAARIGNRHIVETYDAGTLENGQAYIFMELLGGEPLNEWLASQAPCAVEVAVEIALQASDGLAAAHRAGVVHRDIKPGNLFLLAGAKPFVKLLDFGISKFSTADLSQFEPHLTQEGSVLGTPLYMSPEQVMGHRDIDPRTDVYSLGVVLYEMLTGHTPYSGETLMQLGTRICSGAFVPLHERRSEVPEALASVVNRALATDKTARYASCEVLGEALRSLRLGDGAANEGASTSSSDALGADTVIPQTDSLVVASPQTDRAAQLTSAPPEMPQVSQAPSRVKKHARYWLLPMLGLLVVTLLTIRFLGDGPESPPEELESQARAPTQGATEAAPSSPAAGSSVPAKSSVSSTAENAGRSPRALKGGPSRFEATPAVAPPAPQRKRTRLTPRVTSSLQGASKPPTETSAQPAARDGLLIDNPFRQATKP